MTLAVINLSVFAVFLKLIKWACKVLVEFGMGWACDNKEASVTADATSEPNKGMGPVESSPEILLMYRAHREFQLLVRYASVHTNF